MFSVNTNVNSLTAQNYLTKTNSDISSIMARLSSGKRINSAADDAAGLAISTRLNSQSRGLAVASRNASDGISLIQTADSAMGSVTDILQRMRELAVQADNGTYSSSDLSSMQTEFDSLVKEIDHIATNITFNGKTLLSAGASGLTVTLHISDKKSDTMAFNITDVGITQLAVSSLTLNSAQTAMSAIDAAISAVATARAGLGAINNRLSFVINNLNATITNTDSANSRIQDADMAAEMSNLSKKQILQSTAMSMLSKANSSPQGILQLFQ